MGHRRTKSGTEVCEKLWSPVDGTRPRIRARLSEPAGAEPGLTADDIATRGGVPRPAALTRLRLLTALGLLSPSADRLRHRRDETRIAQTAQVFGKGRQRTRPHARVPRPRYADPERVGDVRR